MTVSKNDSSMTKQILFAKETVIWDSAAGRTVDIGSLKRNMEVYVTFESGTSTVAKTITILSK